MRHKFEDRLEADVNVTHKHDIPTEEIEQLIDKVVEGTLTIIVVATVGSIIKKLL